MVNGWSSSRIPTTLKSVSIKTRSKENIIPIVCTGFPGTIQTPLPGWRDLRPNKPTSLPKMESATFTRKARKVSLVLLYTKTCRCSFRTHILPTSFRTELTNANLSTFVAPTSHPTHSSQACRLPKEESSPERILYSFERRDLLRM